MCCRLGHVPRDNAPLTRIVAPQAWDARLIFSRMDVAVCQEGFPFQTGASFQKGRYRRSMRSELDHLPPHKRRELERVVAILFEEFGDAMALAKHA